MRADSLGLFWRDEPIIKPPKAEPVKCTPPEPTWLKPDYLPWLKEAQEFKFPILNDQELHQAFATGERFIFDIECYQNYFLIGFMASRSRKIVFAELTPNKPLSKYEIDKMLWIVQNCLVVSFNGNHYDMPITALALAGCSNGHLKQATDDIILRNERGADILRRHKVKKLVSNHIDLIEVAPLTAGLKIYTGRLHCKRMQDLPFHPDFRLSPEQMTIVRYYWANDLSNTDLLDVSLHEQMDLRVRLSAEYGIDLRSKSDAQIAEAILSDEVQRLNGGRVQRPVIEVGTAYRYKTPHFIKYATPLMKWALSIVEGSQFVVGENGSVGMPPALADLEIKIANGDYRMGIGGLHSSEKNQAHVAGNDHIIIDRDVVSYYPMIILLLGLYPQHLGPNFLRVYRAIVERRLQAKARGDKVVANSLKITINGSFGKLGSCYSILYAPDLLIQVTVTGQLSLLMLIERLELAGISVVSANTDGVCIRAHKSRKHEVDAIVKQWEADTGFETEETFYKALYSRDVNNYIAVKTDGSTKNKGAYANPWGTGTETGLMMQKNPVTTVCIDAVEALLTKGVPVQQTIRACKEIKKFISLRNVKGGAVKDGEYLGKSVRWYYAKDQTGTIIYASSGKKVPRSDGAKPLMELPDEFPEDIDFEWYEKEADDLLYGLAYFK
jgi:hypothetical protein